MGKLLLYLKDAGLQPESVKLENLEHFAAGLHDIGITPRSQARILSGVRSFYKFLLMDRRIDALPTELLPSPKIGEHLPEVLSVEEIDRIISGIDLSEKEGQRNRAIIEMLYSCGLRVIPAIIKGAIITIPSGMFCRAMPKETPHSVAPSEEQTLTPAAMPSGSLCRAIAITKSIT